MSAKLYLVLLLQICYALKLPARALSYNNNCPASYLIFYIAHEILRKNIKFERKLFITNSYYVLYFPSIYVCMYHIDEASYCMGRKVIKA